MSPEGGRRGGRHENRPNCTTEWPWRIRDCPRQAVAERSTKSPTWAITRFAIWSPLVLAKGGEPVYASLTLSPSPSPPLPPLLSLPSLLRGYRSSGLDRFLGQSWTGCLLGQQLPDPPRPQRPPTAETVIWERYLDWARGEPDGPPDSCSSQKVETAVWFAPVH